MKTTKLFYVATLLFSVALFSCSNGTSKKAEQTENTDNTINISNITVSPERSKVMWAGEMLGVYTHTGTIQLTQSDIQIEDGKIAAGSFTIDMKSIQVTDDNYNVEEGNTPAKLIGHLSSPDFFDVENFPTAKFEVTEVKNNMALGLLTIKGTTKEEKIENIAMSEEKGLVTITGDLKFDRKNYDVSWDYPVKEMVLSDNVKVKIELIGS